MNTLFRRMGLPALFLSGTIVGSALTGVAFAGQPHMQNALTALNGAKAQLQLAVSDKGGYRNKAIGYVNDAIAATQAGINYAATH